MCSWDSQYADNFCSATKSFRTKTRQIRIITVSHQPTDTSELFFGFQSIRSIAGHIWLTVVIQSALFRLYFWIYRPHNLLCKYFMVCLFDDHGVDNIKTVTISQWKTNPRILIVHGAGSYENEDSYITIVAVPNLCCRDCKQLRDDSDLYESE